MTRDRIKDLAGEVQRIAAVLESLASSKVDASLRTEPLTSEHIRTVIRLRSLREEYIGKLFADPVWDILLDLFAANLEGKRVSITSACQASGVPATTALRHIAALSREGIIMRVLDPDDKRRVFLELSQGTILKLHRYFASVQPTAPKVV